MISIMRINQCSVIRKKVNEMKKTTLILVCINALLNSNDTFSADSVSEALKNGQSHISFRYRYEFVDQDGFTEDANASTLRTRLNFKSDTYKGLSFFIEADNVLEVFADDFNAGAGNSPGRMQYPVIADPEGTEINQAWFNYDFNSDNALKIGRQRIILDNQRFVGGVGWRQNEQTYDAISTRLKPANSNLYLAFVNHVNRIFGPDVPAGDHDHSTWLANWSAPVFEDGKIAAYLYNIDNDDAATFSTSTYGLKYESKHNFDASSFNYILEYATQDDNANNPVDYSADYYHLQASLNFNKASIYAGFEVLEGDSDQAGAAFRTPLATLHAFNGWADKFLATPAAGLEDRFVGVKGDYNGYRWNVVFHDFQAEDTSADFGSEFDISLSKKINKHYSVLLKAAFYDSDGFATDTEKLWFMFSANY